MSRLTLGAAVLAATPGLATVPRVAPAHEPSGERALVAAVARDYLEAWYTADSERMGRALVDARFWTSWGGFGLRASRRPSHARMNG